MRHPGKLVDLINSLIQDAYDLIRSQHEGEVPVDMGLKRFSSRLTLLRTIGGEMLSPWDDNLHHEGFMPYTNMIETNLAALETIKYAIDEGLLNKYRDLVVAEAFTNLYAQGEHLLSQGYILAAGVIFRAVLEGKLRDMCLSADCMPEKEHPTINDLNMALYKNEKVLYDKATMQYVTALAAIGNDAAHNKKDLHRDEVERLQRGVLDFNAKYSTTGS
jgi:hypothetical protein